MSFKFKRIMLIAFMLVVAVILTVVMALSREKPKREPIKEVIPLVEVLDLTPSAVQFTVDSQGTAQPAVTTQLSAEVTGPIISMSPSFVVGGVFEAGETLMQIDPALFRTTVTQTEAVLKQRQIEYDGIRNLGAKNYRSKIDLASAEAALATAKADVARARRDLDKTRVRLPYAGIVREKNADVGQFVAAGTRLGTTFGTDTIEVRLPLSQSDQRFVDLPSAANFSNDDKSVPLTLTGRYRGREASWSGHVVRTEATIDETNRVTYAVARIDDPYRRRDDSPQSTPLPVGTFVGAGIPGLFVDDVLEIPRSAVRGSGQVVFVDEEGQLRIRDVDIIRSDAQKAYVAAGSVDERRVVITDLETPTNGQQVRIVGEEEDRIEPDTTNTDDTATTGGR
ncbi:MAG: efflux RND transporter periplasmic adaptor subunit [Gammaproteobacteria bacterium]